MYFNQDKKPEAYLLYVSGIGDWGYCEKKLGWWLSYFLQHGALPAMQK
jgi:hypothetical protein